MAEGCLAAADRRAIGAAPGAPLLGWAIIRAGVSLQALITGNSPEGVELIFVFGVGSYSVAAYSPLRRAAAGLAVTAAGATVYGLANHDTMSGNTGDLWSDAFFATAILAAWLAGVFVRGRRETAAHAARTAAAERQAERAVADERARMARELHDIVSHNLSVVILQAAGAQAAGSPDAGTLEKIERSGLASAGGDAQAARRAAPARRTARATGAISAAGHRGPGSAGRRSSRGRTADTARHRRRPRPSAQRGGYLGLPDVQEALTNVLKHAGKASAQVSVRCGTGEVVIEVTDDGTGPPADRQNDDWHGLAGMRERVALFGGELVAGPLPAGGSAVRAAC